jgi:branched-chain amino acid transport system substrate-binding protein
MNGTTRRLIRIAAPTVAVALIAAACGSSTPTKAASGGTSGATTAASVKIGFFGALTGPNAQLGINIDNGAKLAVQQYNAAGKGPKVTLVGYDSQGDPAQAPQLAQKAISDKTVALVGPAFSGESKTADPILEAAGIVNVTPSATAPALADNGFKFFHRVVGNDNTQGPAAADFIAKKLNAKTVAVIDDGSAYGKALADIVNTSLKTDGVSVPERETTDPKATDYSAVVAKINAAKPDVVYYGGYYAAAGLLVKQIRDAGSKAVFVSDDGTDDPKFIDTAGGTNAAGSYVTCACGDVTGTTAGQAFTTAYKTAFSVAPGTYSAEGYDAANDILAAIAVGNTTGATINTFISSHPFTGITKTITFDPKGEVAGGGIYVYQVQGTALASLGLVSKLVGG